MGTIDLRKNRIELVDMPKTFQDAVKVTRALGIRYLWADSLCIVQDNLGDWETEAQLMGEIYQNSILTIAAVEATSGDSGCFERWDGRNNRSCKIGKASFDLSSEGLSNSPRDYRIYVSHAQPKMTGYEDTFRPRGPLDTRGWVLQEEVLSTRVLSFCADGVYWECLHMDGSEHLPTGYIPGRGTERWTPARRYSKAFKRSLLNQSSDEFTRLGDVPLQSAWNALIENYSGRFLTHETDRLIAVQGLARSVQKFTAHGWICGLLEENFHAQLLWHIIDRIEGADWRSFGSDDTNMNISQPKNLIFAPRRHHPRRHVLAPSWSWATVSQRVTWDEGQDAEPIAEILSVKTHKLGVGGVEGRITIRGVILAAQARRGNRFEQ
jgi:hypothetical protein